MTPQKSIRRFLFISANRFTNPYPVYPLGIAYLLTYLSEKLPDWQFRIFDFNLGSETALKEFIRDFTPDYIGLSLRNVDDVNFYSQESFLNGYRSVIGAVRDTTHVPVIVGGSAFSIYPAEIFGLLEPDYGIRGEGEESLCQLLVSLENQNPDFGIPGLVYRENGSVRINQRRKFIRQPDLQFEDELVGFYWQRSGMINIQTKRGCPYRCIYCTYPLIEGSAVRTLDPDRIIHTIRNLWERKGIHYFFFTDSVFNIHNPFNILLAEKLIAANLPVKWGAYFSPHNLDAGLLQLFSRAGLTHIEFGTESLSDATLKNYGKHFTVDEVVQISSDCSKAGIYFCHFMIIGGYGETDDTVNESFENSERISDTVFFPFTGMRIYPGTRLHELAIRENFIRNDDPLLEPVYYLAPGVDYSTLKSRAEATGRRWVFPDEDLAPVMNRMRQRNRKGSLWHHLRK